MSAHFDRIRELFLAARDLDPAERQRLIAEACADDDALREEVESLLCFHDNASMHPTTPAMGIGVRDLMEPTVLPDAADPPGRFGGYEILGPLGRGGMGTVYRARQQSPDRIVALKVIRSGMMSPSLRGRFQHEAEVLGRLHHPGIAQIFEAGATDDGQPYFAMELVEGMPLDRYAREQTLPTATRLELMVRVCDAVHHAHQKGVIHRDIKPANIIVDESGQPKILDFGVARATDRDVRTTTLRTSVGEVIGTLPYMSPEQVGGDPRDVDVRSDVYSLGVVLYELLAGRLPHDLDPSAIAEAARRIRETEPLRLSTVSSSFRGDIETIVHKALDKDPARRYDSAAALADDLRRHLQDEPIMARAPSVAYQAKLFARRHRVLVTAVLLVLIASFASTVISTRSASQARRAAKREANQRITAERVKMHLNRMLLLTSPHAEGGDVTVERMLDLMVQELDAEGEEIPEVEADVRLSIGSSYRMLGRLDAAHEQLRKALALWRRIDRLGPQTAATAVQIGLLNMMKGDDAAAKAAYLEALAVHDARSNDDLLPRIEVLHNLVSTLARMGEFAEAEPYAVEMAKLRRELSESNPTAHAVALRMLGFVHAGVGDVDSAESALREALEVADLGMPRGHPIQGALREQLASILIKADRRDDALPLLREAWLIAREHRRVGSPDWRMHVMLYASCLTAMNRDGEVKDVLVEAKRQLEGEFGVDDPRVAEFDGVIQREIGTRAESIEK